MSFSSLLSEVVARRLCVECGACAAVCPDQALVMEDRGGLVGWEPALAGACSECGLCSAVCPGADVPLAHLEQGLFGRARQAGSSEDRLGVFRRCFVAQAARPEILARAAAGGTVTSLLAYALAHGIVEAALVATTEASRPWRTTWLLATTPAEVLGAAGTQYQAHPHLGGLREAVRRGIRRLAVVGTPCHVHALRLIQDQPGLADLAGRIRLVVGLFDIAHVPACYTESAITDVLGVALEDVRSVEYRARPWPGVFQVTTADGTAHREPSLRGDLVRLRSTLRPDACETCLDASAVLADISVADAWGHSGAEERSRATGLGWNGVLVRTPLGEDVLAGAVQAGYLVAEEAPRDPCFLERSGPVLQKSLANAPRAASRAAVGLPSRRYDSGPRHAAEPRPPGDHPTVL